MELYQNKAKIQFCDLKKGYLLTFVTVILQSSFQFPEIKALLFVKVSLISKHNSYYYYF